MNYKKGKDYLANGLLKRFYSTAELAEKLGTSSRYIGSLISRGLPYLEISATDYRFDIVEVNDWLDENQYTNENSTYFTGKEMMQYYGFGEVLLKRFRDEGMPYYAAKNGCSIKYNPELVQSWISAHYSKRKLVTD